MSMFCRAVFCFFVSLCLQVSVFSASVPPIPAGTKLVYSLQWSVFSVGEAVMTIGGPVDFEGQTAYTLNIKVRTNSFADTFYKVRNESTSWLNEDWSKSLHFESDQKEGSHERQSNITFDWSQMMAQYSNYGEKKDPVSLEGPCFDPFGVSLGVCKLPLNIGETVIINVTNGKKLMEDKICVVKKERIRIPLGRLDSIMVEPGTEDLGGVFNRSEGAEMRIWLSDDEYQIPVRIQSEVSVGSFWGELIRVEGPIADYYKLPDEPKPIRRGRRRR